VTLPQVLEERESRLHGKPGMHSAYPVVTEAVLNLNNVDDCLDDSTLSVLERFIIIMIEQVNV